MVTSTPRHTSTEKTLAQFDDWAEHYDSGLWSRYFARSYEQAANILQARVHDGLRMLDLGCGTGGLAFLVATQTHASRVVGLDLSPKMVEQCRRRARRGVEFLVGEASCLPFASESFDAVACLNSFHHYPDAQAVLSEIARCLAPRGVFLLLDPVQDGPLRRLWAAILRRLFDEDYASYYTSERLRGMLEMAGLEVSGGEYFMYFTRFTLAVKLG